MTFPGTQILLQAGSWEKLCEIRTKNVAMASQQPQVIPSSAHPGSLPSLASCSNQLGD